MARNPRVLLLGRLATVVVVFVLLALLLRGPLDSWINHRVAGPLDQANEIYLEESFDGASRLFLILTGIKSVLAVVEGSEIGVGFGLELGDVVQGVYDYIDFAWRIVLWATVILVMTRMLLEVVQFVDQWLLALALASIAFYLVAAWFTPRRRALGRVLRDAAFFSTILSVAAYFVVPLAVAGGAALSREITASRVVTAEANLVALQQELEDRFGDIGSADGFFLKAAKVKEASGAMAYFLRVRTKEIFWDVITISAAYLFDTILFPLGLFLILFWLARLIARYLFGLRKNQVLREDLDGLFARYFEPRRGPDG